MIASLKGVVESSDEGQAVIDVNGVGYLVFCSNRTLSRLPGTGSPVRLEVETHVREDHIHLYGFSDAAERTWFRLLTTVQGVGARVALAILSVLSHEELAHAVATQDKTAVARANGVGPKLAGRIVLELKDKVGSISFGGLSMLPAAGAAPAGPAEDAVSALVNLGFARPQAVAAVSRAGAALGEEGRVEELIRAGLKELSQ